MMSKKELTKIAKRIVKADRGLRSPQLIHPNREWGIGILSAVIIFVACAVWSASVFLEYRDISVSSGEENTAISTVYREAMVERVLGDFKERADEHARLKGQMVIEVEPEPEVEDENTATSTEETIEEEVIEETATSTEAES
jgi:hypothetical protein